jgi:HK97 gp10 family phage protein
MANIKGIKSVTARFQRLSKQADLQVKSSVRRNADQIFEEALSAVHVKDNHLRSSGNVNTQNPYLGIVAFGGSPAPYAPYVEFGTGENVAIPAGFAKFAMEFYVNGKGRTMPHPYLIPAYIKYSKIFLKDMRQIAKNISK